MGRKIFVSYKFADNDVLRLLNHYATTARDYVTYIEDHILGENVYKGEHDGEDLSDKSDDYIWNKLKDKIQDSTLTIVLISPNMREPYKHERSQWIPWELAFSLRENTRNDRTSHSNAVLAVILPNKNGSYDYYYNLKKFKILDKNISNGYIPVVTWNQLKSNLVNCIRLADKGRDDTPGYLVTKSVD